MSMHQGAKTVEELLSVIKRLGSDMQEYSDCDNGTTEVVITLNASGGFTVISD